MTESASTNTINPVSDSSESTSQARPTTNGRRQNFRGQRSTPKFEGKCLELKNAVFTIDAGPKQFETSLDAIGIYVGTNIGEIGMPLRELKKLQPAPPTKPVQLYEADGKTAIPFDQFDIADYKEDRKDWKMLITRIRTMSSKAYALILGQCSPELEQTLQGTTTFTTVNLNQDPVDLLKLIKGIMFKVDRPHKHPMISLTSAYNDLYHVRQKNGQSNQDYFQLFNSTVNAIEHSSGGFVGDVHGVAAIATAYLTNASDAQVAGREFFIASLFLQFACPHRYKSLWQHLEREYLTGHTSGYPATITEVLSVLNHWNTSGNRDRDRSSRPGFDTAFTTVGTGNGNPCRRCGHLGHDVTRCHATRHADTGEVINSPHGQVHLTSGSTSGSAPTPHGQVGQVHLNVGSNTTHSTVLAHAERQHVPPTWILLDNQSTINLFVNGSMLQDIHSCGETLQVHSTAGVISTDLQGTLPGFGPVWFVPNGIANIMSLSLMSQIAHVQFDSEDGNHFHVRKYSDDAQFCFEQSKAGLYYLDTKDILYGHEGFSFLTTVADNKSKYAQQDVYQADIARKLHRIIGRPSSRNFKKFLNGNMIKNCPVSAKDITAADHIYGTDVGILKGKTTRRKSPRVRFHHTDIPVSIMQRYQTVTLCVDIMKVNGIPFLMTISRHIRFGTAKHLLNQQNNSILSGLKEVCGTYRQRGFRIHLILADGQFESLRGDLATLGYTGDGSLEEQPPIALNVTSRDEHVPEIERYQRTVKERSRCLYNTLPYTHLPPLLIIGMVHHSVFWLNSFPHPAGISDTISPAQLIVNRQVDFHLHCRVEFGAYVQTHEEHDNSMGARTLGAIALYPNNNAQGGFYFMNLLTGQRIARQHWDELPVPDIVISRVRSLARRAKSRGHLIFTHRDGTPFPDDPQDDPDDPDYDPTAEYDSDDDTADAEEQFFLPDLPIAGVNAANADAHDEDDDEPNPEEHDVDDDEPNLEDPEYENDLEPDNTAMVDDDPIAENDIDDNSDFDDDEIIVETVLDDDQEGVRTRRNPRVDYKALHHHGTTLIQTSEVGRDMSTDQMSMKKGLKLFKEDGERAVSSELQQLHDMNAIEPVKWDTLSRQEKSKVLNYLMYLKRKRCGRIKARGCADGRKQRLYMNKEDASSPTVLLESVKITCAVDAHEGRDVATVDIPGAFLQTSMEGEEPVHIRFEGTMAKLLTKINPKLYEKYQIIKDGKPVIYVKLNKALYGTLKAALLFWEDLSSKLVSNGFIINPYDFCVANKIINGKQCTIIWHVDDLKISHVDSEVVTSVIGTLNKAYGKHAPLTVTRGKVHDYLGMRLDYSKKGEVHITMIEYIDKMLEELPTDMQNEYATPAALHLFKTNEDEVKLDEATSDLFHHNVAKLLFLCKRARPDIQTAIAFLTTRVKGPDIHDYKKLARTMGYLRATRELPLILKGDSFDQVQWWIDGAYAVHDDMKSHTGIFMSMGGGAMYSNSIKQKLNTKSSTEAELVAVDDAMSQLIWTRYFLHAQGYDLKPTTVHQDNQSAILLEKNGRRSSGKRTRHINIRYFFIADRCKAGEVEIKYCPTDDMIGDFFTKPLQGSKFKYFRNIIMGVQSEPRTYKDALLGSQECVEPKNDD